MNLENSPDWRATDHEDAVSASIDGDPCTFRRELWQSYADLFRMDTIFEFPGRHVEQ